MEALWNLEDKLKLSTHMAIGLFTGTLLLVIGVCLAVASTRRKARTKGSVHQEPRTGLPAWAEQPPPGCQWRSSVVKALTGSVRWNGPSKWEEGLRLSQREAPAPLLVKMDVVEADVGRISHNSSSAVWQRPILMGEKCELPRFSGLILYDQRGRPLHHGDAIQEQEQENSPQGVTKVPTCMTALKDLL